MRDHQYFVYILASRSRQTYIGVTNDLVARLREHRAEKPGSYTARFRIHRLVYFERWTYITNAIRREKYLKHMTRAEKDTLIEKENPAWDDLSASAFPAYPRMVKEQEADPPPAAKDDKVIPGEGDKT